MARSRCSSTSTHRAFRCVAATIALLIAGDVPLRAFAQVAKPAAPPAPPLSTLDPEGAALSTELEAELKTAYQNLIDQARALPGGIDGLVITDATRTYALLTRNLYLVQLAFHVARLQQLSQQTREQKIAHIKSLQALAKRIEYWWRIREYGGSVSPGEPNFQGRLDSYLREQMRQAPDKDAYLVLQDIYQRPESWEARASAEIFKLIDLDPVVAASEDFLEELWSDSAPEELLEDYDEAVASGTAEAQGEMKRVGALNTVEGVAEFLQPQYVRTRAAAAGLLGRYSVNLQKPVEDFARSYVEHLDIRRDPFGLDTPLVIGGLIILSLIVPTNMPILLAVLGALDLATAGYTLYHDVPYLLALNTAAANARAGRGALGSAAAAQITDEQLIVALGVFLNALGIAVGGRALAKSVAESRAADLLRRARARAAADGSPVGDPQRGAKKALKYGISQSVIDATLKEARTVSHEELVKRVIARGYKPGTEAFDLVMEAEALRDLNRARPYLTALAQIDQLDNMQAAARAAGVSQTEIDAMIEAARGSLSAVAQDLPRKLLAATLNKRGITVAVDIPFRRGIQTDDGFKMIDDVPGEAYVDFWLGPSPVPSFRTDLQKLKQVMDKLDEMRGGLLRVWSREEIALLQQVVRTPNLSSVYAFVSDERVLVKLFKDDDLIEYASRFLVHPNRAQIAQGKFLLPSTTPPPGTGGVSPAARGAGASDAMSLSPFILTGAAADEARHRLGRDPGAADASAAAWPGGGGAASSEQQLAAAAIDRARTHFNTDAARWTTVVLPDGRVATTSPNQTQRVIAYTATGADGSPRIHLDIDHIRDGRHITVHRREYTAESEVATDRNALPDLEGPFRPVSSTPTPAPARDRSVSNDAAPPTPIGLANLWTPKADADSNRTARATPDSIVAMDGTTPKIVLRHDIAPITFAGGRLTIADTSTSWTGKNRVSVMNTDSVNNASTAPGIQSLLSLVEEAAVLSDAGSGWREKWTAVFSARPGQRLALTSLALSALGIRFRGAIAPAPGTSERVWGGEPRQTTPSAARPPLVKAFFTSLGETAGEAFRVVLVNEGVPLELSTEPFVLEPLARLSQRDVDRELQRLKSQRRTTATVLGYCLEFAKQGPPPGMIFRIASEPVQQKFAAARPVIRASRTLLDAGKLSGGKSDSYLNQVRQWSIWTIEQKFDEAAFGRAALDHARKNFEAAGRQMTRELETQLRQRLPTRWRDIRQVLDLAAQQPTSVRP